MDYKKIEVRLRELEKIIENNRPDTDASQDASDEIDNILFENMTIKDFVFIGEHLNKKMTIEDQAKMVAAAAEGLPLTDAVAVSTAAEIAYLMRRARLAQNISQTELAKSIGVTQGQIAKIENAQANVSIETLQRIATVLGESFLIRPAVNMVAEFDEAVIVKSASA
ncbi:MAG: helix-turn-helix domain-containing protein [Lactobacillaceae bacterium]|jgi:DNA-binding XRE family transcriptional regulator|nr:helix-turn-helix domain-containing protein [Lactobacillaceae bacterium]